MNSNNSEAIIEALNQPPITLDNDDKLLIGWQEIAGHIGDLITASFDKRKRSCCTIAVDGYIGVDWTPLISELKSLCSQQGWKTVLFDVSECLKSDAELDSLLSPYLGDDPVFGKVYKKGLRSLFDAKKLTALKSTIQRQKREKNSQVIICFGAGAALPILRRQYDYIFYADLTRQEVLKRNKNWSQLAGKTQSISPKKLYYVDFQVHDQHRNYLLHWIDYYIDGNNENQPLLISKSLLTKTTSAVASSPFRLKPIYEPGPWGGHWLKKIRKLPHDWVNCAWSYEVIAQEQSLLVSIDNAIVEFPWNTLFRLQYKRIMGDVPRWRFGGEFPIRYDYLDTMGGGDLSIQVHPTTPYIRHQFNEPYHQGEMYYIVAANNDTRVNLGLNEDTQPDKFYNAARLADEKGIAFNYRDYVNSVPSKTHDLLLIPPGTVHGSGAGQVVLEISATTYRYTFKLYDHLRPDLNGIMRPIHIDHGFNVIKWFRRSQWVEKNLKQLPRIIRSGNGWAEYVIGDQREFFHIVMRLEFEKEIADVTNGKFHILTLVQGESVSIHSVQTPDATYLLRYSETIIIPACLGRYTIINRGQGVCKIAKARLRK